MPTARRALAGVAVNGKIYAIGGGPDGGPLAVNEEYDPTTNTWTTKAAMPTARTHITAAVANSKIYVFGGYISAKNEEYDPATNAWTAKADMPTARRGAAAATVNDKIYVIGGTNDYVTYTINEEYDLQLTHGFQVRYANR
jgi:N-acetylneuraminic acid mutarotase